jgi:SAM-dependent methyltransferase
LSKEISFSNEARTKIKAGIDKAFQAVAPTLGAVGMSAIIDWEGLDPIVSDDGVTILKNLEFKDNSFDAIWSMGVIHHTPNINNAISEILRVLKPHCFRISPSLYWRD